MQSAIGLVAAGIWAIGAIGAQPVAIGAIGAIGAQPVAIQAARPVARSGSRTAGVVVQGAWIREAPPGAEVLAAYLEIRNPDAKGDTLVSAQTPIAEIVSIHRTVVIGGVARMEHLESLPIPGRTTVRLRPGGDHLMIMFPTRSPRAGDKVPLTLRFRRSGTVRLVVPVRSAVE